MSAYQSLIKAISPAPGAPLPEPTLRNSTLGTQPPKPEAPRPEPPKRDSNGATHQARTYARYYLDAL